MAIAVTDPYKKDEPKWKSFLNLLGHLVLIPIFFPFVWIALRWADFNDWRANRKKPGKKFFQDGLKQGKWIPTDEQKKIMES